MEHTRNLPDDRIDLSDIPERIHSSAPSYALIPSMGGKKSITIRLDADMVDWYRKRGRGWQTLMNWVLRIYFLTRRRAEAKGKGR